MLLVLTGWTLLDAGIPYRVVRNPLVGSHSFLPSNRPLLPTRTILSPYDE